MPFGRSATPTGLIALSHVRPSQALGHGTNDVMAANRVPGGGWSAAGAQGNPCIEQGIKGPAQGNASRAGLPDWLKSKNPAYEAMADADE
jgi:hypothetical protein